MNFLTNLAMLVKQLNGNIIQLNGNTIMVGSSIQLSYTEHYTLNVNQGAKLNDGAEKNILTSR
jgi:hypothetical protein